MIKIKRGKEISLSPQLKNMRIKTNINRVYWKEHFNNLVLKK